MSSLVIDVWTVPRPLCRVLEVAFGGKFAFLFSEKAEACFHVFPGHIVTALLLPLFLLTLGLWYVVALARIGFSPVAGEI